MMSFWLISPLFSITFCHANLFRFKYFPGSPKAVKSHILTVREKKIDKKIKSCLIKKQQQVLTPFNIYTNTNTNERLKENHQRKFNCTPAQRKESKQQKNRVEKENVE